MPETSKEEGMIKGGLSRELIRRGLLLARKKEKPDYMTAAQRCK